MDRAMVDRVRHFNRTVTQRVGALDDRFLARDRPLAEARSPEPPGWGPPAGIFLVAYLRSEPVGCGAAKHHPGAPSEIKRMWVADTVRGLGLGRRLLAELEAGAARSGAPAVRLETNGALVEAIALYRSAGYREVPAFNDEPFAHHWFEKRL